MPYFLQKKEIKKNIVSSAVILLGNIIFLSLSMPMGVDYVVKGFDMEVQPLVTHNAA